jgi:drug/metabolite transporter (DMT)-like permease
MPVIVVWLILRRELRHGLDVQRPLGHFWRGLFGITSMGLGFAGLGYLPLPEVTAIGYAAPLLTVVFAALLLGETVRAFRISAVGLGMAGVLIVLAPRLGFGHSSQAQGFGAMLVLSGAVFSALAQVQVRKLVQTEKIPAIVFYFSLTGSLLALLTVPFGWVIPTPTEAALLIGAGLIGGVGQIFLTSSYREADASLVAPFDYASILFALAIGYWVFGEVPTLTMLSGAAIVVFAGVLIIWRERQLGLERARQRKAMSPQG